MRPIRFAAPLAAGLLAAACQGEPPAERPAEAPRDAVPAALAGDFDARGTEPFWAVRVRQTQVTLLRPDHPDLVAANPGPRMEGETAVWTAPSNGRTLVLRVTPGACSDGMSDLRYPYEATVQLDGEVLRGCAGEGELPEGGSL